MASVRATSSNDISGPPSGDPAPAAEAFASSLTKVEAAGFVWKFLKPLPMLWCLHQVLRLTKGGKFTFPAPQDIRALLAKAGFVVEQVPLDRGYHVPHMPWVARNLAMATLDNDMTREAVLRDTLELALTQG